ncbi:MAG: hypothetical protein PVF15_02560 [Candidatus Bathyarchaeota archaeon]|jgi:hypothetical protein
MKHAIRALGWATAVLWILVILFSGTVVYSALQIEMNLEEELGMASSNGTMTMSFPFSVVNGGLYDISELNITTRIIAENEIVISSSATQIPLISRGETVSNTHDISVSLDDILAKDLTNLLFNDTDLDVDMYVGLTYAYAIPLKISSNLTMPWGAPLSNLTIGEPSISLPFPDIQVNVPFSFENHAFFGLNGTVRLEIMDGSNNQKGSGTADILVPPGDSYDDTLPVTITGDPQDVAEIRLYFDTSQFSFGPMVIPIE